MRAIGRPGSLRLGVVASVGLLIAGGILLAIDARRTGSSDVFAYGLGVLLLGLIGLSVVAMVWIAGDDWEDGSR
jgi:hypothetical protein